jgi:DNA-binding beta-propeller fold protein YncE
MRTLVSLAAALLALGCGAAQASSLAVVNQGDASVSIVDPETLKVTARIAENLPGAVHAHEAAVSPDGRTAYLPVYGDTGVGKPGVDGRSLLFVDLATHTITGALDFGHGVRPHFAVVDPNTGLVYVTTELNKAVTIVDPRTRTVVGQAPTGAEQSHMLILSHDGRYGYTANVGPGSVSVLDLKARKTAAIIPVSAGVQRIAISVDDKLVFTSDTAKPRLAVIDTVTRKLRQWIPLPGFGYGAAATKDGRWLLIALPEQNEVGVIDLQTMTLARTIPVGKAPQEVLIRPDGAAAYVSCAESGTVCVIDLAHWTESGSVATGPGADGLAWAGG